MRTGMKSSVYRKRFFLPVEDVVPKFDSTSLVRPHTFTTTAVSPESFRDNDVMYQVTIAILSLATVLLADCFGPNPPPQAQPRPDSGIHIPPPPVDPCAQAGPGYTVVDRIFVNDPARSGRNYGSFVLLDGSGRLIWMLQSSRVGLAPYAGNNSNYQVEGRPSSQYPDLLIVCTLAAPGTR
jgi:hypothetical protein